MTTELKQEILVRIAPGYRDKGRGFIDMFLSELPQDCSELRVVLPWGWGNPYSTGKLYEKVYDTVKERGGTIVLNTVGPRISPKLSRAYFFGRVPKYWEKALLNHNIESTVYFSPTSRQEWSGGGCTSEPK